MSPYGASKLAGEGYCSAYNLAYRLETVALRFGNVYGPGSGHKNSAVARFIRRASNGEALEIYGDGTQTRDFIYIEDLIRAVVLAATTRGVGGETFQIATSAETTVQELIEHLVSSLKEFGIDGFKVRHTSPRAGDVSRNYADTSKRAGCWAGRQGPGSKKVCAIRWSGPRPPRQATARKERATLAAYCGASGPGGLALR